MCVNVKYMLLSCNHTKMNYDIKEVILDVIIIISIFAEINSCKLYHGSKILNFSKILNVYYT